MFEICPLMFGKQFDYAPPKPVGRVKRLRAITPKFASPLPTKAGVHLPTMRVAYDGREIVSDFLRLFSRQILNLNFEILRK
jgi:hypothetical protein